MAFSGRFRQTAQERIVNILDPINDTGHSEPELSHHELDRFVGGLTSSQVGQRGDAVPTVVFEPNRIVTPQAYLFWTGGGWHGL